MESNRYRSRDDLAHDLDISKKTIQRRIRNLKSQVIKRLCKEKRTFNSAEYQRILNALSSFPNRRGW
jgi:predicted HTH transcriptional regulator